MTDPYPTDEQLDVIECFAGSVLVFWGLVDAVWNHDYGTYERHSAEDGATVHKFSTGGWSGNESVISTVDRTMARMLFWESSRRGGHHEYVVPAHQAEWELPALGLPRETVEYGVREYHSDGVVVSESVCADQDDAIKAVGRTEYHRAELVTRTVTNWKTVK